MHSLLCELMSEDHVRSYLSSLRLHHAESYCHSVRVGDLSIRLGWVNKLCVEEQKLLGYAGLLHDLGKSCIPHGVLGKPGVLDECEAVVMRGHSRLGFVLLDGFDENVRKVVVAHHEFKGCPYPRSGVERRNVELLLRESGERRQVDERVRVLAQMVAVADVYDALSCRRVYKSALPFEEVETILRRQYTGDVCYVKQVLNVMGC